MKRAIALCLLLGGCVSTPVVNTAPSGCSSLVPAEWKQGVDGVDPPGANGQPTTVADWEVGFDGQTGKLDQANGRTRDAISIVSNCEARDAAAVKHATRTRLFGIAL